MATADEVRDALLERIAYHIVSADAHEVVALSKAPRGLRALECDLALVACVEGARTWRAARYDAWSREGIALRRDNTWLSGLFLLAETAARLHQTHRADALIDEFRPYEWQR